MERGQVLLLVTFAIVGIIAIMGLALDVGVMFIENARLRRAVDAAALAAALQFREGYTTTDLDRSAQEFLILNGIHDPHATVDTCSTDATLCTNPQRKLVRVVARATAPLAFLPVIGIDSAPIGAMAVSETASVDVVLVFDRSESMTYDAAVGNSMRDPSVCNASSASPQGYVGDCEPFNTVKDAAISFVNQLYFPYDRVAVVTFDQKPNVLLHFSNVKATVVSTIANLTVFQGEETGADPTGATAIYPSGNPSRFYDGGGTYLGLGCPQYTLTGLTPAACTTTNIGGGLMLAGDEFAVPPVRQQSLWVVILLTDGVANAGYGDNPSPPPTLLYYCPLTTWSNAISYPLVFPKCNDSTSHTRHNPVGNPDYDAEDFAYDMADFIGQPAPVGQNALLFTVGLGQQVTALSLVDSTPIGELFLQYAANTGNGLYYDAPNSSDLREIFRKIAENIATRLAK